METNQHTIMIQIKLLIDQYKSKLNEIKSGVYGFTNTMEINYYEAKELVYEEIISDLENLLHESF